jgi:hypothetical protein
VKLLQVDARAPLLLDWFIAMGDSNSHAMSLVSEVLYLFVSVHNVHEICSPSVQMLKECMMCPSTHPPPHSYRT